MPLAACSGQLGYQLLVRGVGTISVRSFFSAITLLPKTNEKNEKMGTDHAFALLKNSGLSPIPCPRFLVRDKLTIRIQFEDCRHL